MKELESVVQGFEDLGIVLADCVFEIGDGVGGIAAFDTLLIEASDCLVYMLVCGSK